MSKTNQFKVSVIVPVYNAEKYLLKCINSIRMQTHENLQIILVDDGSSDQSPKICDFFSEEDFRIEVYHIENIGSVGARKYGLKRAEGEYIGFVDADDYIEPDMYMKLLSILIENDADFVHSGHIEEKDGLEKEVCCFEERVVDLCSIESRIKFIKRYMLGGTNKECISSSLWSKLYKGKFIKKCFERLLDEQQYGEDLICLCRCILECKRVVLSRNTMYHYVVRKNSLSHLKYEELMINEVYLWRHVLDVFKEYNCINKYQYGILDFFKYRMLYVMSLEKEDRLSIPRYFIKEIRKLYGKRIVLFGAGRVGQDYYFQISKFKECQVVGWIDSHWEKYRFDCIKISDIQSVTSMIFDFIVIAVSDRSDRAEMKRILVDIGVSIEKIYWKEPGIYY